MKMLKQPGTPDCVPAKWTGPNPPFVTQSYFTPFMVHTGSADAWLQRFRLRLVNSVWFGLREASLMSSRVLRAGVTDHPGLRVWCQVCFGHGFPSWRHCRFHVGSIAGRKSEPE